jgi:hypothetical protein
MKGSKDGAALVLLLGGVGLAFVAAFFLPALHVRGADKALLGISAWEAVPVMTLLKVAVLLLAVAAAFLPKLQPARLPLTVGAIAMMFAPALGALVAGVYQWSEVRAEIVQLSGQRAPWIDPGWGVIALLVAALMMAGAAWRAAHVEKTSQA